MQPYKITVRDDPHDEAFKAVGEFIRLLSDSDTPIEVVDVNEDSYVVRASLSSIDVLRRHGDVDLVCALI